MIVLHWFTASWLQGCFYNKGGFFNSPYFIVLVIGGIFGTIGLGLFLLDENWKEIVRWISLFWLVLSTWPFFLPLVVPAAVVVGLVLVAVAWFDLVPSKAERAAKKAQKVKTLRGELADAQAQLRRSA